MRRIEFTGRDASALASKRSRLTSATLLMALFACVAGCGGGGGGSTIGGGVSPPPPPPPDPSTVLALVNPTEPPPALAGFDFTTTKLAAILPQIDPLTLLGSPTPRFVLGQSMLLIGQLLDAATKVFVDGSEVPVQFGVSAGGLDGILVHLPVSLSEGAGRAVTVLPGGGKALGPLPIDLQRVGLVLDVGATPGVKVFDLAGGAVIGSRTAFPTSYPWGGGLAAPARYTGLSMERHGMFYMAVDVANRDLILGSIVPLPRDLNPGQFSLPIRLTLRELVTAAYHGGVPPAPVDLAFAKDTGRLTITFAGSSSKGVVVLDTSVLDDPTSLASNAILGFAQAYGQLDVIVFSGGNSSMVDRVLASPLPGVFLATDDDRSVHVIDETGSVSRSLPLGQDPTGMSFASVSGGDVFAYVALAQENKVVWFDLSSFVKGGLGGTPVFTAAFTAGSKPIDLAVRPQGDFALLCNAVTRDLSVFRVDPTNGDLGFLGSVPLGGGGLGSLAVSPDGAFAFVTSAAKSELLVVDLTNVGDPTQVPSPTVVSLGGYPARMILQPGS